MMLTDESFMWNNSFGIFSIFDSPDDASQKRFVEKKKLQDERHEPHGKRLQYSMPTNFTDKSLLQQFQLIFIWDKYKIVIDYVEKLCRRNKNNKKNQDFLPFHCHSI